MTRSHAYMAWGAGIGAAIGILFIPTVMLLAIIGHVLCPAACVDTLTFVIFPFNAFLLPFTFILRIAGIQTIDEAASTSMSGVPAGFYLDDIGLFPLVILNALTLALICTAIGWVIGRIRRSSHAPDPPR